MIKPVLVVSLLTALFYGAVAFGLKLLNDWFHNFSIFGITFLSIDLRVWFLGFCSIIFGVWAIIELDDYLQFKKWRKSWK